MSSEVETSSDISLCDAAGLLDFAAAFAKATATRSLRSE
jgi:hypothetical protein